MNCPLSLVDYLLLVSPVFFMGLGIGLLVAAFAPPRRRRYRDRDVTRLPSIIIKD